MPSLSEHIAAHARQLERAAEDQDAVDARGNAAACYRAAAAMARLAKLLA